MIPKAGGHIWLIPHNHAYSPILADTAEIIGKRWQRPTPTLMIIDGPTRGSRGALSPRRAASSGILVRVMSKVRLPGAGVHLFDRASGLNVLLDEVKVPAAQVLRSPRYLSVALTNTCELRCAYCYAPKRAAALDIDRVVAWAVELDGAGCLGVGFGGVPGRRPPSAAGIITVCATPPPGDRT